jgi:nucleotide-binding universal stress UspA family protein
MRGTIVCGVADGAEGRAAVQLAGALAARLGLRLVLVHIVTEQQSRAFDETLEAFARELCDEVEVRVVRGNRVDGLAQAAADEGADAIVLGSRPRGARGRQLRCTLARQLEAAQSVPVLIAPPATRERNGRRLSLAQAQPAR